MASRSPYDVSPLPTTGSYIRLLTNISVTQTSSPSNEASIAGELKVVKISDNPTYAALSYSWGVDKEFRTCHVRCGEVRIPVTESAHTAILSLFIHGRLKSLPIWIDAICINQADDLEKGCQLPLMKEIYGNAEQVYIWLGPETSESECTLEWMRKETMGVSLLVSVKFKNFPETLRHRERYKVARIMSEIMRRKIWEWQLRFKAFLGQPAVDVQLDANTQEKVVTGLRDIMKRQWFTRMWTLQEVVMANQPIVILGSQSIRWLHFVWAIKAAGKFPGLNNDASYSDLLDSVVTGYQFWADAYMKNVILRSPVRTWVPEESRFGKPWKSLMDFLEDHGTKAWKTQFAMAGTWIACRLMLKLRPLDSVPAMALIWAAVVTRALIPPVKKEEEQQRKHEAVIKSKFIDILHMTRSRQATNPEDKVYAMHGVLREVGMPLQAINVRRPVSEVYHDFSVRTIRWLDNLDLLLEAGGGQVQGAPSWVPDWSRRHTRLPSGSHCSSGTSVAEYSFRRDGVDIQAGSDSESDAPELCVLGFMENSVARVWRTASPLNEEAQTLKDFLGEVRTLDSTKDLQQEDVQQKLLSQLMHDSGILPRSAQEGGNPDNVTEYHRDICQAMKKRALFQTRSGQLGVGPQEVSIDDEIALVAGFKMPLVLRKAAEEGHKVIGTAYIHDMMQGQRWTDEKIALAKSNLLTLV